MGWGHLPAGSPVPAGPPEWGRQSGWPWRRSWPLTPSHWPAWWPLREKPVSPGPPGVLPVSLNRGPGGTHADRQRRRGSRRTWRPHTPRGPVTLPPPPSQGTAWPRGFIPATLGANPGHTASPVRKQLPASAGRRGSGEMLSAGSGFCGELGKAGLPRSLQARPQSQRLGSWSLPFLPGPPRDFPLFR